MSSSVIWFASLMNAAVADVVANDEEFFLAHTIEALTNDLRINEVTMFDIVVAESEGLPDLEYDPAAMLEALLLSDRQSPRYIVAVRTFGQNSPKSQDAFAAEFSLIAGSESMVVVVDAVRPRLEREVSKEEGSVGRDIKVGGLTRASQWPDVARYAKHLANSGAVLPFQPVPSEAADLVEAMYRPGTNKKPLSKFHKAVLVGLADCDSTILHDKLGYSKKTISNAYGPIATCLGSGSGAKPQEYCCMIADRYRSWLRSYGMRRAGVY